MSLFTSPGQLPNIDEAAPEKGLAPAETAAGDDTATGKSPGPGDAPSGDPGEADAGGDRRAGHPATAPAVAWATTALAAALVLFALLLPNTLTRLTPSAFIRVPVEGIFGVAVLLVLPPKVRRVAAVLAGIGLGLLTVLKFLDMGFYSVLDRPFDLVLDWILLDDAEAFLRDSVGQTGAIGAVVGLGVLVLTLLVSMTLAVVRLSDLMVRHSAPVTSTTLVLGTVWITCVALGAQITGVPVAARNTANLVNNRAHQISAGLKDKQEFSKEASIDAFRDTPADQLLTGLRGKDVIFAFVESYGRVAIDENPQMAKRLGAVLADGTDRLRAAGFSSRSAFLTSPTTGAGSWLAHSTLMSGLWIDNEQRYRSATSSDRLTLTGLFQRAKAWRTVGVMPGVTRAWPEGQFYGFDRIYNSRQLGYKGPKFSWTPVPDQYSLSAFERLERGKPGREPLMAGVILASSHNPWAPIPKMIDWDQVGDGSVYHAIKKEGKNPKEVWKDRDQVRTEYRRAIEYSVNSLVAYMEKYGDKNTVLVFLGDHQPVPAVVGDNASREVPITIVARDPAVMDRISDWGWQEGLKPGGKAPIWRMDTFRDRFLTAYGPRPGSAPSPSTR